MAEITDAKRLQKALPREFERLSLNQRIQHMALFFSFILLVVTGMPLRYWQTSAAQKAIALMGGIGVRSVLHRIGAVMLILLCIYHLFYVLFSERGARDFRELVPARKDFSDLLQMLKYFFGLGKHKPRFGRYSYLEKFEYFAVGWGSVVMVGTGLVLWFQVPALMFLPKWALDVAQVIHSWEGLLAFLAIIIWHFYNVHFGPEHFPFSLLWWHGRIGEKEMMEHHSLEYEQLVKHSKDRA